MAKIIVEVIAPQAETAVFYQFSETEITVGRGFGNHVILSDSFVAADHVVIRLKADSFEVEDRGSRGGFFVNRGKIPERSVVLSSGGELLIGRTRVRLFLPDHPVVPQKALFKMTTFPERVCLRKDALPLIIAALCACQIFIQYGAVTSKLDWGTVIRNGLMVSICLIFLSLLSASFWAFIGHLVLRRVQFKPQFYIGILFSIALFVYAYLAGYLLYPFPSNDVIKFLYVVLLFAAFFPFFRWNLAIATNLSVKKQRMVVVLLFSVIFGFITLSYFETKDKIARTFVMDKALYPPLLWPISGVTVQTFIDDSQKIFSIPIPKRSSKDSYCLPKDSDK